MNKNNRGEIIICLGCEQEKPLYRNHRCYDCYRDHVKDYRKRLHEKIKRRNREEASMKKEFWTISEIQHEKNPRHLTKIINEIIKGNYAIGQIPRGGAQ